MKIWSSCLCLTLLAAPAAAEDLVYSGEVELTLSPISVSGIPIDVGDLPEKLCGAPRPIQKPLVECHLIVKHGTIKADVDEGGAVVRSLPLGGARPLAMPCGLWDTTLTLDSVVPQPISPLALTERPDDPDRGVFAMALGMNTRLRLKSRETGRTVDIPLVLGLDLAGPWVLGPPPGSTTQRPLILLTDREAGQLVPYEDCVPAKVSTAGQPSVELNGCNICLTAVLPGGSGTQN